MLCDSNPSGLNVILEKLQKIHQWIYAQNYIRLAFIREPSIRSN